MPSRNSCVDCGWDPGGGLWPTFGPLACRWIEECLILAEGDSYGKPFRLRRDQKLFIYEWYSYCLACDRWRYKKALRGAARGDGKTALIAAVAVLEFAGPPEVRPVSPNVVMAAKAWSQAGLLYAAASTMLGGRDQAVEESPLCGFFEVYEAESKHADGTPGRLFRIAAEAGSNQGGQATLFLADEIHEFGEIGGSKARFHGVISHGTTKRKLTYRIPQPDGSIREVKRGPGRTVNLSTAGDDVDHSLLGEMYKEAKRVAAAGEPTEFLFDWHEAPKGLDYTSPADRAIAVRAASGAADVIWSVSSRVREWDDPTIPHSDWRRYFANEWVDVADDSWLVDHPQAWDRCQGDWDAVGDEPTFLAVDMSLKRDTTAVVEVALLASGRLAVTSKVWEPDGQHLLSHKDVFDYIRGRAEELGDRYRGLVYDPRYFQLPAEQLEEDGYRVIVFEQNPRPMSMAVGETYDRILDGTILHDGDYTFRRQVMAARKREGENQSFTLSKGKSRIHIDACVALCMGVWMMKTEELDSADIYDQVW